MFEIYDGRAHFYQWDLDRKLIVNEPTINQVHFCNKTDDCSLVCETYELNNQIVVNVPNILLQDNWRINVYAYDKNYTKFSKCFNVIARTKPEDYIYTETEIKTFAALEERMDELEATVSVEGISKAVEDYLTANPPAAGATEAQAAQIEQNAEDIKTLQEQAALKTDIPSLDGYATEDYVGQEIRETELYVNQQVEALDNEIITRGYLTEHQDVSHLATKSEIPDVSGFTTMVAVEAKGYQTEEEVRILIEAAIPASGDEVSY